MSSYEYDYSSYDSSTDEEYEKNQEEILSEQIFNAASDYFYDVMYKNNIRSPLNGPMDGDTINACLRSRLCMCDVVSMGRLKYSNKTALGDTISDERILDFREAAKAMVAAYLPEMQKQVYFVNSVTARLIKYHYKL